MARREGVAILIRLGPDFGIAQSSIERRQFLAEIDDSQIHLRATGGTTVRLGGLDKAAAQGLLFRAVMGRPKLSTSPHRRREPLVVVDGGPRRRHGVRRRRRPENPLTDPLSVIKRPLSSLNGPAPGYPILEFEPIDVREIRQQFHVSQRVFAEMLGINLETLRNWEQGRRSPHGPGRALLRLAAASPRVVAKILLAYRRPWWWD